MIEMLRIGNSQQGGGTAVRETGDGTNFAYLPGGRWEIRKYWDISQVGDGRWVLSSGDRRLYHTPKGDGRRPKILNGRREMVVFVYRNYF